MTERASRLPLTRASAVPTGARTRAQRVALFFSRVWAWAFLGLMVLFFVIAVPLTTGGSVNFLTIRNSQNILVAIIPVLLLGLGQTFVIIAAGIDLSVGWVMSLASVLSALALRSAFHAGVPLFPSVLIGLIAALAGAAAVGLVNGVIIAKLKVPAFIVTLGTSFIVRGIAYLMSENTTVIGLPPGIRAYGNDALVYYIPGEGGGLSFLQRPEVSGELLRRMDIILPYPVVVTAFVVAWAIFLLHKTQFGRHTYAIGGSMDAAVRSGIPVDRQIILIYILSAATSGIAGFLSTLAIHRRLGGDRRSAALKLDRRRHHRRRQHVRRRRNRDRHGDRRPHHRRADDRARDAQRRCFLAVHRRRNRGHCRGADRPVARPHHWPHARRRRTMSDALLAVRNLTKIFGGLVAVNDVSFDVARGEVVGLLGDNGAGKSTLIKCISGVHAAEDGRDRLRRPNRSNSRARWTRAASGSRRSTRTSRSPTISTSAQTSSSAARSRRAVWAGSSRRSMTSKCASNHGRRSNSLHIRIPALTEPIEKLSGGQRQAVAIARAVYWDARLMIMDEPTNNLGVPEQHKVLELIRTLKGRGVPVILITHVMPDALAVTDRIIVMHRGRKVAEKLTAHTNAEELVQYMVGAREDAAA